MIDATTRACRRCTALLGNAGDEPTCPRCGAEAAPHVSEWPPHLKRWLVLTYVRQALVALWQATLHQRWEHLLRAVMRGKWWGHGAERVLLTRTATAAECYAVAVREHERWLAAGGRPALDDDYTPEEIARARS